MAIYRRNVGWFFFYWRRKQRKNGNSPSQVKRFTNFHSDTEWAFIHLFLWNGERWRARTHNKQLCDGQVIYCWDSFPFSSMFVQCPESEEGSRRSKKLFVIFLSHSMLLFVLRMKYSVSRMSNVAEGEAFSRSRQRLRTCVLVAEYPRKRLKVLVSETKVYRSDDASKNFRVANELMSTIWSSEWNRSQETDPKLLQP